MKTYLFKATDSSTVRGYNRTIDVYRMKHNRPEWIGRDDEINTASTYGDKGEAVQLIAKIEGVKADSYNILDPNVQLFEV